MNVKSKRILLLFLLPAAGTFSARAQIRYRVTNLGPAGSISSSALAIAGNGSVVGTAEHSCYCGTHAFLYNNGAITDLATLGGADSTAVAINSTGQIAGHSRLAGDTIVHAFLYNAGTMTDLGTLGGSNSFARAINDSGQVAGYSETFGARQAFLYSNGSMSDLGTLGGSYAEAQGINASGEVVGVSSLAGDMDVHAFAYVNGSMNDLGTLGGYISGATAVNSAGAVVGYSNTSSGSVHAFLYANGTMTDLGAVGGDYSVARGIDDNGDVVGITSTGAFVYTNGAMVDLNQTVGTAAGWDLREATSINKAGQIVGYGVFNGQTSAFLLSPSAPVPAPTGALSNTTPLESTTGAAGLVNYEQYDYPYLDSYIANPTPSVEQFFGDHIYRMSSDSPYFDPSLSWFPRTVVYIISYGIANNDPLVQQHPEWIMHDQNGNLLYIPFNCSGGTCPHYAADFTNPAFRAYWIANAQASLAHGYTGIWVDDVNLDELTSDGNANLIPPIDHATGQPMTQAAWWTYMDTYVEQIRYTFPFALLEHNSVWYANTAGDRDANPAIERQIAATDIVHLERGIGSDPGLQGGGTDNIWSLDSLLGYIDRVHQKQKPVVLQQYTVTVPQQEYSVAGYFLISQGRDTTGDSVTSPDNWYSGFNTVLGLPSGPRIYSNGLYQRRFSKGMVLLNEPNASTINVQLDGIYSRPDGSMDTSVTLGGTQAAVLTRVGPVTGGRWISDLSWVSATNGYMNVQLDVSTDGNLLTLNGNRYLKGLGTNADSTIHYDVAGACTAFTATVGVDDEVPAGTGSADFQVWADGKQIFGTGHMTGGSAAQPVNVNLAGVNDLALVVSDDGYGTGNSHADWAGAFLSCSGF